MTYPVPADQIEGIVGAKRHPWRHIARAVTAEMTIYILHPDNCAAKVTGRSPTECRYSRALDDGIRAGLWARLTDRPVYVAVNAEGLLFPQGDATGWEADR